MSKVFFIGAGKMGTSSLTEAIIKAGGNAVHTPKYGAYSHLKQPVQPFFQKYDFFLDGNFHNIVHLHNWFPTAKFVLLTRDPENWIFSFYNWNYNLGKRNMKGEWLMLKINQLLMNRYVFRRLAEDMMIYQHRVQNYFVDRPNFIVLDVADEGDAGWQKLSAFLNLNLKTVITNTQKDKLKPKWLKRTVETAQSSSIRYSKIYPNQTDLSNQLLHYAMHILVKDFIHERHLAKNCKDRIREFGWCIPKAYLHICIHVFKLIRVGFALGIRIIAVHRNRKLCPFIY